MLEFSMPLVYDYDFIDKIAEMNTSLKKSKITNFYSCVPLNSSDRSYFEQDRVTSDIVGCFDDLNKYIQYAFKKGFTFTYLMNSVRGLLPNEFKELQPEIDAFIDNLLINGITDVRVTNTMVIGYLIQNHKHLNVHCSTSQEYSSVMQYKNLLSQYPEIKSIVPSYDLNKNFLFLTSLKEMCENEIELMVDEGCLPECPFRNHHNLINYDRANVETENAIFYNRFFNDRCAAHYGENFWTNYCLSKTIAPWEVEIYAQKYGIRNFKLVGRNTLEPPAAILDRTSAYLHGIEDASCLDNYPVHKFNHFIREMDGLARVKYSEIKSLLPKLEYFEKNGHLCKSACGISCTYCLDCAEAIAEKTGFNAVEQE